MNGLKMIFGSLIRNALMALSAALISHHYLTPAQTSVLPIDDMTAGITTGVVTVGWSLWQKAIARWKFLAALQTPPPTDSKAASDNIAAVSKQTSASKTIAALIGK